MRFVFRILSFVLVLTVMFFSASCSEKKCIDVIPSGSTVLMSIDVPRMKSENMDLIKNLFNTDDIENCGLDLDERMYIFETADGNFGLLMSRTMASLQIFSRPYRQKVYAHLYRSVAILNLH